jgi:hypothetical protein
LVRRHEQVVGQLDQYVWRLTKRPPHVVVPLRARLDARGEVREQPAQQERERGAELRAGLDLQLGSEVFEILLSDGGEPLDDFSSLSAGKGDPNSSIALATDSAARR